jgi:hypothetical protein
MLSIANEESRDVRVLKQAALERMALDYRVRVTERIAEKGKGALGGQGARAPLGKRSALWTPPGRECPAAETERRRRLVVPTRATYYI